MTCPVRGAVDMPFQKYGVAILVIILACLIILTHQGIDIVTATAAVSTATAIASDLFWRFRRHPQVRLVN